MTSPKFAIAPLVFFGFGGEGVGGLFAVSILAFRVFVGERSPFLHGSTKVEEEGSLS